MPGVHPSGSPPGDGHGEADDGDDGRQSEVVGNDPDRESADELQDDRDRNVIDPCDDEHVEAGENDAHHDASTAGEQQSRRDAPARDDAGHRGADGQAIDEQGAGIVEQALALEDHEQPLRQLQAT